MDPPSRCAIDRPPTQEVGIRSQLQTSGGSSKLHEMASTGDTCHQRMVTTSAPKLAENHYGREEFLALFPGTTGVLPELRETFPEYYVEEVQQPVCIEPFNAVEQRLLSEGMGSSFAESRATSQIDQSVSRYSLVGHATSMNRQYTTTPSQPFRPTGIGRGTRLTRPSESSSFHSSLTGVGRGRRTTVAEPCGGFPLPGSSTAMQQQTMISFEKPTTLTTETVLAMPHAIQPLSPVEPNIFKPIQRSSPSSVVSSKSSSSQKLPRVETPDVQHCWYYIDSKGKEQGPFDSNAMAAWYAAGYFLMAMKIRREDEEEFITLGDLIKKCSCLPFIGGKGLGKTKPTPVTVSPVSPTSSTIDNNLVPPNVNSPVAPASSTVKNATSDTPAEGFSVHQTETVHGHDLGLVSASALASSVNSGRGSSLDSEMVSIQENQRENRERDRERTERANAELGAKLALLEERMRQNREEERKAEEERQRKLAEAEKRRQLAEMREREEQLRQLQEQIEAEEEEARRIAEEARRMEEEARRIEEEERKKRRLLEEQQRRLEERQKKEQEEQRRRARVLAEEERLRKLREDRECDIPAKPAPWAGRNQQSQQQTSLQCQANAASTTQSLREIQVEEERQARAEKRQELELARQQKRNSGTQEYASGPWGQKKNSAKQSVGDQGLWATDLPSDEGSDVLTSLGSTASAPADPFTKWCIKQIRALNSEVDGATILEILNDTTSPSDAETFVMSYFGDCRPARDFLEAYLQKRSLAPSKGGSINASQSRAASETSRKAGKAAKTKKIIDDSTLGFRLTADPNRVNVGAIDRAT